MQLPRLASQAYTASPRPHPVEHKRFMDVAYLGTVKAAKPLPSSHFLISASCESVFW